MKDLLAQIDQKKNQLARLRPLPKALKANLDQWLKIELTYSSNAIEGNTLSRKETALVVEKNLAIEGKPLAYHLEAINHAQAWELVKKLTQHKTDVSEKEILEIHRLILNKIDDTNTDRYRSIPVRISGSTVILPNPLKVPDLMAALINWLKQAKTHPAQTAAEFHLKFVSIHPFVDGNGRTARLLFNLILLKHGYPPTVIPVEKRLQYLNTIETAQLTGKTDQYYSFIYRCVLNSLDFYLHSITDQPIALPNNQVKLLTIGQLARLANEPISTLRFWIQANLLTVSGHTKGGYQLFNQNALKTIQKIRRLQKEKRLTIKEIKAKL